MKFYIILTLFIFMCIFLANSNTSYFTEVKEHFEENQDFQQSDENVNKLIENKINFIEYYIGRRDTALNFNMKNRVGKYKDIVGHINILMDTIINHNNKKYRADREMQYVRRYVNKLERQRKSDCIEYKIEVLLYNTSKYSTVPYIFEFCVKNNKFIIKDIKNIDEDINLDQEEIPEKIEIKPSNEQSTNDLKEAFFKEDNILTDLVAPKSEYNPEIDTPVLVENCDYLIPPEKKIYDWHPSYIQVNDIDHDYDFVTPVNILSI